MPNLNAMLGTAISVTDNFSATFLEFEKKVQHVSKPIDNLKKAFSTIGRVSGFKSFRTAFVDLKNHSTDLLFNVRNIGQSFGYIGTAVKGVVSVLDKVSSKGDDLAKTSLRLGFSVVELQQFRHVANLAGVSAEAFTKGMKKLSESSVDAAGGAKIQKESFKSLGIAIKNTDGSIKSSQDLLLELSGRFAMTGPGAYSASEKIYAAQKLLGKSGTEMITILNQGPEAIKSQMDELLRLGYITEEQAKKSEAYKDALARMQVGIDGLTAALAGNLLEPMTRSVVFLTDFLTRNRDVIADSLNPFIEQIPNMAKSFTNALPGILDAFTTVMAGVNLFIDNFGLEFPMLAVVGSATIAPLVGSIFALLKVVMSIGKPIASLFALFIKGSPSIEGCKQSMSKLTKVGSSVAVMSKKASVGLNDFKNKASTTVSRTNRLGSALSKCAGRFNVLKNSAVKAGSIISGSVRKSMKSVGKLAGALGALYAAGSFFEKITDKEERGKGLGRIFVDTLEEIPIFGSLVKGVENLSGTNDKVKFDDVSSLDLTSDMTSGSGDFDDSELFRETTKTINNNSHSTIDVNFNNVPKNVSISRNDYSSVKYGNSLQPVF